MTDEPKTPERSEQPPGTAPDGTPVHDAAPDRLGRRGFLNLAWKVAGVALIAEAAWTSYDILNPRSAAGFGSIVDAGPVSDYLKEGTVKYSLDGRFYVTQYQGGLRALYQKCPHLGCRVPFCESAAQFQCPCHGSIYNLLGEYLGGPAPRGMDRFDIKIEGGNVLVDTSSVVEGPPRGVITGPTKAAGPSCLGGTEGAATPSPSGGVTPSPGPSGSTEAGPSASGSPA
jgi:cytochrome b6-f complex iron-sulfur subunit